MKTRNFKHPPWMNWSEGMVCIEPGAQVYKGGNVMIQFLCRAFFLVLLDILILSLLLLMRRLIDIFLHLVCTLFVMRVDRLTSRSKYL